MQAVSGCGSLLCLGHALAQCSGVARPSSVPRPLPPPCKPRVLTECVRFPCGSFQPQLPAWGRAGTALEAALRARCAIEQPMRLGPHLASLSPCALDVCVVCCHRILAASRASSSQWSGGRRISTRSSRRAAFDEPRVHAWRWSIARVLSPRLLLRCTVLASYKNVDLLVAYLGSSVELARDRGCSEHPITMFYDVVSSVLREC